MPAQPLTPGTLLADEVEILSRVDGDTRLERYLARHLSRRGHVLLHVLREASDGAGADLALKDLKHACELFHHNIAPRQGCGRTDKGLLYLVEGYPPGERLSENILAKRGAVEPARALERCYSLLRGLAAAHEAGVYHGALDPSSVLIERVDGAGERVRILGLGVVQAMVSARCDELPRADALYRAPEDGSGTDEDLYATGALLLAMAAGTDALREVRGGAPLPTRLEGSPLGPLLSRALEADAAARFDSAESFARAVDRVRDKLDAQDEPVARSIGFDSALSSAVGVTNPGVDSDATVPDDVDWLDLLPSKTSTDGRPSALTALEAELAFSGQTSELDGIDSSDVEETRVTGPPVPEAETSAPTDYREAFPTLDEEEDEPAPDTVAVDPELVVDPPPAPIGDDETTHPGRTAVAGAAETNEANITTLETETDVRDAVSPADAPEDTAVTRRPIIQSDQPSEDVQEAERDEVDAHEAADVTRLSPPPTGPPRRKESTRVGRPVEPEPDDDAGTVEQRTADAVGVRTESTQIASRPVVDDDVAPPVALGPPQSDDAAPPGSAFEFIVEPEVLDEIDFDDELETGDGVRALRGPEPTDEVEVVVHETLQPSSVPADVLLAREAERAAEDEADDVGETTSPGTPRSMIEPPGATPLPSGESTPPEAVEPVSGQPDVRSQPPQHRWWILGVVAVVVLVVLIVVLGGEDADTPATDTEPAPDERTNVEDPTPAPSEQRTTMPAPEPETSPPPSDEPSGPTQEALRAAFDAARASTARAVAAAWELAEAETQAIVEREREAARQRERERRRDREDDEQEGGDEDSEGGGALDLKVD